MRLEHTLADLPLMLYAGVGYTERFPDYWELFSPKLGPNGSKDPFSSVKSEKTTQLDIGAQYNGKRNLYFHVNPPLRDITKKAEREDIKEVAWLHVDIDPRAGEDIEEERTRALALLTVNLPQGVPPPSVVVFSGGGYQGFWKLEQPIPVDGLLEKAEDAKRYNQQLEVLFGADNCHNIDRIMRLPGTVNLPDARKLKKGRQPELARLLEFHDDRVYPLNRFTPAPSCRYPASRGSVAARPSGSPRTSTGWPASTSSTSGTCPTG